MYRKPILKSMIFALIFLLAGLVRFTGLDWDQGTMQHPDERFLVMVTEKLTFPEDIATYLDPARSPSNPANAGFPFYVYGLFPLIITKLFAVALEMDFYPVIALAGRVLTATMDLLALLYVYKTGRLLEKHRTLPGWTALSGMLIYAVMVLPIQLSHFFAVDPYLNTFILFSLYHALHSYYTGSLKPVFPSAMFLGLAVASKVSAVFVAPVLGILFAMRGLWGRVPGEITIDLHQKLRVPGVAQIRKAISKYVQYLKEKKRLVFLTVVPVLFVLVSYVFLRFGSPYYFQTGTFFDPGISESWKANLDELKSFEGDDVWYPPAIQWMSKPPVTFALLNLVVLGTGPVVFILFIIGVVLSIHRYRYPELMILLFGILCFFLYQSSQFVKALRYFLFLYPFIALFAGIGVQSVLFIKLPGLVLRIVLFLVAILLWPLMFMHIYLAPHTRIEASRWIYKNLPDGSFILSEHWDDGLPLPLPENEGKRFTGEQLEVFGMDTPEKFQKIQSQMERADYYILSSNRGWGSMPYVPWKYPQMASFYEDLFAGKLGYVVVKEFTRYPSLQWMGIPLTLPDDWADETFTVYDHPKVIILKREK